MQPYRLLMADDHVIFREMVTRCLDEIPGLEVVGAASNGLEALELTKKLSPDMVILDIGMPHNSGLELAGAIKNFLPEIKILFLTMHKSKDYLSRAVKIGCEGYVLKDDAFDDLVSAISTIRQGKHFFSTLLTQAMHHFLRKKPTPKDCCKRLTPKEIEVLKHLSEGKSVKDIADLLLISKFTVTTHIANIKRKLSINTTIKLIRYALRNGYASLS